MNLNEGYKDSAPGITGFLIRSILLGITLEGFNDKYGSCTIEEYGECVKLADEGHNKPGHNWWRCDEGKRKELRNI